MAAMNVSLPEPMRDRVEAQSKTGRFSSASDYVRDQERADKIAELQKLITEGIESGISTQSLDDVLQIARERVAAAAPHHGILVGT